MIQLGANRLFNMRYNLIGYFVLLGIVLSPFEIKVKLGGAFITPVEILISLAMLLWIPEGWQITKTSAGKRIIFPLIAFIAIAMGGLFVAVDRMSVIKETLQFGWFIVAIVLTWWVLQNAELKNLFLNGLLIVTGVISIYAIIQYFYVRIPIHFLIADTRIRATAYYDQPNAFGNYMLVSLMIIIFYIIHEYNIRSKVKKHSLITIVYTVLLFITAISFMASFSRGSWMGFGVGLIIGFYVIWKNHSKVFISIACIIIFSFALIQYDKSQQSTNWLQNMYDSKEDGTSRSFSNQERLLLLKAAWNMAVSHPILGVGFGNYQALLDSYSSEELKIMLRTDYDLQTQRYFYNPQKKSNIETVHNLVLQVLCETGFLGFLAFLWLWIEIFRISTRKIFSYTEGKQDIVRIGAFCGMIAALFAGLFGWPFVHGVQEIFIASCALALPTDCFQ